MREGLLDPENYDDHDISLAENENEEEGQTFDASRDGATPEVRNRYMADPPRRQKGQPPPLESLDFDWVNNPYWVDMARRPPRSLLGYTGRTFGRWSLVIMIGFSVAMAANFISFMITSISNLRNNQVQLMLDADTPDKYAFLFFAIYNLALVAIGTGLTVGLEPAAAAGGIPEIKAYLNGTHIRDFLRLRAIFVKVVGTIMSVASGMACGQEAPMIHIGAGIASGLTRSEKQLRKFLCWRLPQPTKIQNSLFRRFHNDKDRREFICAGAGAGMAAAFGAPVGGVLFVLEEAASHWTPRLIWRVFAAALCATFTLAFTKAGENAGDISLAGLLSFGTVQSVEDMKSKVVSDDGTISVSAVDAPVYWWEILFFALVGVGGGILGGVWDVVWNFIASLRPKRPVSKALEVLAVSLLTSTVIFYQAYAFPQCRNNGSWTCRGGDNWGEWCGGAGDNTTCGGVRAMCFNASAWVCRGGHNNGRACRGMGDCEWRGGQCEPVRAEEEFGVRLGCPVGQYDELATIFFGTREQSITRLFTQAVPHEPFANSSLLIAGVTYLLLMLLTYGIAIPAGLFMPSVMVGACLGRLVGQLVKTHIDESVFSGAYALAGAAAMLGGVQRATISLVVIIIEGTANVHFLLPIVVTTCTAKFVGNLFGHEGVYEIGIRRKKLRFLEHEPEWIMDLCTAGDVMSAPVRCLPIVASVGSIVDLLRACSHNGFPVLSLSDEGDEDVGRKGAAAPPHGKFEGLVLRAHLQHLLSTRFLPHDDLWLKATAESLERISLDGDVELYELMATNNRSGPSGVQEWEWSEFSEEDRGRVVNVGAYMNCACYTVVESCPLSRAYKLFRSMGLRHLPVIDVQNHVVGMLARDNYSHEVLNKAVEAYYREEEVHQQFGETRTPRLCGEEQVARQRERAPLTGDSGATFGGAVLTWQVRLASVLRQAN